MLIVDLIPFIQNVKDSRGNSTGQSFISYGKILDKKFNGKRKKNLVSVFIMQVFDVQAYINEIHNQTSEKYTFAHQIQEYQLEEIPPEFVLDLKHKKIMK